jgi:orotidine-5'-phosphate decarboxylase
MVDDRGTKRPLWQAVVMKAQEWNTRGNVGIVMGATYPAQLAEARTMCPEMPILVPGVGAQEGSLGDTVRAGLTRNNDGIMVSASRSIIYAARDADYAMAARAAAAQLRDQIMRYLQERPVPTEA